MGWVDETSFLLFSYLPDDRGEEDIAYLLLDSTDGSITELDDIPGWDLRRMGDDLVGASAATLRSMPITGGEPVDVRILPTQSHYLAAVLDVEAQVTPTTVPPNTPVTTVAAPGDQLQPPPAVSADRTTGWIWPALGLLVLIGAGGVFWRPRKVG